MQRLACRGSMGMLGAHRICWGGIWSDCGHLLAIRPIRECVFMCLLCLVVRRIGSRETGAAAARDRLERTLWALWAELRFTFNDLCFVGLLSDRIKRTLYWRRKPGVQALCELVTTIHSNYKQKCKFVLYVLGLPRYTVLPVLPVLRPTPITWCCTLATPSFLYIYFFQ